MVNVMSVLQEFIVEAMLQTTPRPRDRSVSRRLHRAIVEAVREGDPDAAERAMREHMDVTRARLEEAAQDREPNVSRPHPGPPEGREKRRRVDR